MTYQTVNPATGEAGLINVAPIGSAPFGPPKQA
jgi:hypothetical protein